MFKQTLKLGINSFRSVSFKRGLAVGGTLLAANWFAQKLLFQNHQVFTENINPLNQEQKQPKTKRENDNKEIFKVEEEAIFLNKQAYMSRLLGNKNENYILIVYAEDTQETMMNAVRASKHLKKITKQNGQEINVYVVSRPTLEDVKKLANRVMDFKIFEKEENPENVEIYIKTIHSSDMVYVKCKRESFFTDYKSTKFIKKLNKYVNLFNIVSQPSSSNADSLQLQEQQLAILLQRQYVKLDQPTIIKCVSAGQNKKTSKELKQFKKLSFLCMERKLIPMKSQIIIIENKEIIKQYSLQEGGIYILRNDIIQKLENSVDINKDTNAANNQTKYIIDDSYIYLKNARNTQTNKNEKLNFFLGRLESYSQYKTNNVQLMSRIEQLTLESTKAQSKEEIEQVREEAAFVNFIMPRVTYLRDSQFGSIGKLFKKITFSKEKQVLSLLLQQDDKVLNHNRLKTFNQLYQQYKNEFTFMIVDTKELVDLFPHIEDNQPPFSVFNFFKVDKSLSKVSKYYKHLIFPFEKYFLEDKSNLYEDISELIEQVDSILLERGKRKYVVNQTGMIQNIDSEMFDNLLKSSTTPFVVHFLDDSIKSRLSKQTLNEFELERITQTDDNDSLLSSQVQIYRMEHLNQHQLLKGKGQDQSPLYIYVDPNQQQLVIQPIRENSSKEKSRKELANFLHSTKQSTLVTSALSNQDEQSNQIKENQQDSIPSLNLPSEPSQTQILEVPLEKFSSSSQEIILESQTENFDSNENVSANIIDDVQSHQQTDQLEEIQKNEESQQVDENQ